MKSHRYLLLFIVCFIYGVVPLFAVAKPSQEEKVYLHFDNTAYFMGETIWFKAYVVQAGRNGLSPLSKTLYVDLVSPDGNVVEAKKYKLVDGKANGEFVIKDSLLPGFYEVRAYTRFMLNQGDEAIFNRVFACYEKPAYLGYFQNPTMPKQPKSMKAPDYRPKPLNSDQLNVFFYPEGGDLIEQLTTRVAFKAFELSGEQVALSGVVLSKKGDTLANVYTSNMGMGVFEITPEVGTSRKNKPYTAVVTYNDKKYSFDLPQPLIGGYALTVDATNIEQLEVYVQSSPVPSQFSKTTSSVFPETLGVDISCRGVLYGEDTLSVQPGKAVKLTFPTRMMPSGVAQINLHTINGEPLAQRLVFVNHHSQLSIEAKPDKTNYRPFEPIKVDFYLKDAKANPVQTEFSLSIRDAETTPNDTYTDNLLTNLLLSSELRGYIQSPGYYFQDDSPERRADLDLLMMTQGWSRYEWKRIAGWDTTQFKHLYEESLLIEGNVYTLKKTKPNEGVEVNVTLKNDSIRVTGNCISDSSGRFNMMIADINGKSRLKIETKLKGKPKKLDVRLDRVFSPPIRAFAPGENLHPQWETIPLFFQLDTAELVREGVPISSKAIEQRKKTSLKNAVNVLPEVVVKGKRSKKSQQQPIRDVTVFIDLEETIDRYVDMGKRVPKAVESLMYELLPDFSLRNGEDRIEDEVPFYKTKFTIVNVSNFIVPLNDKNIRSRYTDNFYRCIYSSEVSSITVRETATSAFITINCKSPDKEPKGIQQTRFQGYSLSKTFYSPPYNKLGLPDSNDVRRTLYWNPSVKTDANGKAKVSFFNNRSAKVLNINAETVTSTGMMGVLNQ